MAKDTSAEDDFHEVTYHPRPGDPQTTTWRGHTFKAGEAVKVKNDAHADAFGANKFFEVKRKKDHKSEQKTQDGKKSADDMRGEFGRRLEGETTVEGVIRCFADERKRREEAGVGDDDMQPLMTQLQPRLLEMRMREGMGDRQVAEIWLKYGMSGQ